MDKQMMDKKSEDTKMSAGMVNHGLITDELQLNSISPEECVPGRMEFNVHDPITSFTGREEILSELHNAIEQNKLTGKLTVVSQARAITGVGGVGKTETVRKYISVYKNDYAHVLWINAENRSDIRSDFIAIAKLCHRPHKGFEKGERQQKQAVQDIYDFICQKPCLVIFDNVETLPYVDNIEDCIRMFLPQAAKSGWEKPAIIATSRSQDWKEATIIELSELEEDECYELLAAQLDFPRTERNFHLAEEIAGLCERLPLAVQQVIGIIQGETEEYKATGQPPFTMKDFLAEFNDGKGFVNNKAAEPPVSASVLEIFKMSFRKLAAKKNGHLVMRCLHILALLNPENIPILLLTSLLKAREDKNVLQALNTLQKYNLVAKGQDSFRIHRVIQLVILFTNKQNSTVRAFEHTTAVAIASIVPNFQSFLVLMPANDTNVTLVLQNGVRLADHADAYGVTSAITDFLMVLGNKLNDHGKHHDAEKVYRQVLEAQEVEDAHYNIVIDSAKQGLALAYTGQAKYEAAIKIYNEILYNQTMVWGLNDPKTLKTKHDLATVFRCQCKYTDAVEMYNSVLKLQEGALEPDHTDILTTKNSLAKVLQNQGRYEDALKLYNDVVTAREKTFGPEHTDTLRAKHSLAMVYQNQGKFDDALRLYNEVLRTRESTLGKTHPETLTTKQNVGALFRSQGKYDEAVQMYEDVLNIRQKILGPTHPDTLQTRQNLGIVYDKQGKYDLAIDIYDDVLKCQEVILGPNHSDTLRTKQNLAVACRSAGRHEYAVKLYKEVILSHSTSLGRDHPQTLRVKHNLASVFVSQGKYGDAMRLNEDVLTARQKLLGPNHPDTARSKYSLATVYKCQGNFSEAIELFKGAIREQEEIFGPQHTETLESKQSLAELLVERGRYEDAADLYKFVLEARNQVLGPNHPDTIKTERCIQELLKAQSSCRHKILGCLQC